MKSELEKLVAGATAGALIGSGLFLLFSYEPRNAGIFLFLAGTFHFSGVLLEKKRNP
ncbi:MAG: hypothetical protein WC848_00220 [Parcubacteria group bacterium]|jgi:hypothetical protein